MNNELKYLAKEGIKVTSIIGGFIIFGAIALFVLLCIIAALV